MLCASLLHTGGSRASTLTSAPVTADAVGWSTPCTIKAIPSEASPKNAMLLPSGDHAGDICAASAVANGVTWIVDGSKTWRDSKRAAVHQPTRRQLSTMAASFLGGRGRDGETRTGSVQRLSLLKLLRTCSSSRDRSSVES